MGRLATRSWALQDEVPLCVCVCVCVPPPQPLAQNSAVGGCHAKLSKDLKPPCLVGLGLPWGCLAPLAEACSTLYLGADVQKQTWSARACGVWAKSVAVARGDSHRIPAISKLER